VAKTVKWALPIWVQKPLLALRRAPLSSTLIQARSCPPTPELEPAPRFYPPFWQRPTVTWRRTRLAAKGGNRSN